MEERDCKFLIDDKTPNIGPGHYSKPGAFDKAQTCYPTDTKRFVQVARPGFSQSTKRETITTSNYNPGPGSYLAKETFKMNFVDERFQKEQSDPGIFYVMENGNL